MIPPCVHIDGLKKRDLIALLKQSFQDDEDNVIQIMSPRHPSKSLLLKMIIPIIPMIRLYLVMTQLLLQTWQKMILSAQTNKIVEIIACVTIVDTYQ